MTMLHWQQIRYYPFDIYMYILILHEWIRYKLTVLALNMPTIKPSGMFRNRDENKHMVDVRHMAFRISHRL